MNTLSVLLLSCLLGLVTYGSDLQVVTTTTTNTATSSVTTVDVFKRNGSTNLVRQTKLGDGGVHVWLQQFYHDGSLVAEFGGALGNRTFAATAGSPYRLTFGLSPSGEIFSVVIAGNDGVCVDAFGCTNGVFYPQDASGVRRMGAFMDAFKEAVVVSFPHSIKPPERK